MRQVEEISSQRQRKGHFIPATIIANRWLRHHSNTSIDDQKQINERLHDKASSIAEKIKSGNRGVLASSITLVETEHKEKKKLAKKLLQYILSDSHDTSKRSLRIGSEKT
ncbi:unnamed protein product [Orchesella dallaii]|uniref:Uncharacterized protein n=1 Tax=Orchesella dallaii TaxID=48710 RepID=A0ABP1QZ24_9HEXA